MNLPSIAGIYILRHEHVRPRPTRRGSPVHPVPLGVIGSV